MQGLLLFLSCYILASATDEALESTDSPFGHKLLSLFQMDPEYTNLNFGSYGSVPVQIGAMQTKWEQFIELNPDVWFRYDLYSEMDKVRDKLAQYVNCDPLDLAFVENASEGVNAILRSIHPYLPPTAKIMILDLAYGMVKSVLSYLEKTYRIQVIQVNITFPVTPSSIVDAVRQALKEHPEIVFASLSHITSTPAVILPIKDLIEVLHTHGAMVLIDGAHALGHIPIDIKALNPDFYVSNGHKWMFTPKGSAFLYVRNDRQFMIWPPTISDGGQGKTRFQMSFSYEGTKDYTPNLCFGEAFNFRERFGDKQIMEYIHKLAVEGGDLLARLWGTDLLVPHNMIGAMVNVRVPSDNATLMGQMPKLLLDRFDTWVPFFQLQGGTTWYTRVSAQIFNQIEDFQMLGDAVKQILSGKYEDVTEE